MYRFLTNISLLLILSGCKPAAEKEEPAADDQEVSVITLSDVQMRNAGIETGTPVKKVLNAELKVNGTVDVPPQNIVSVSFPIGGYLKTTKLLPGMHVNKGEVIGLIEDQGLVQLQQDYLVAVARLNFLEQEYQRQKELQEGQVSAQKVFQQTQSEYSSQKVLVKAFAEKLRMINMDPAKLNENSISRSVPMYSPITGFVSKVNVNIGKFVNPTDVLFELINPDDMHAALTVFEKDMPLIKIGQKVKVSFVDDPTKEYECEVILSTKNVDESRSGTIHCHFEKMPKNLLPGMFLNATILISDKEALTVPEEAVVSYAGKQYVLEEASKNTFSMIELTTGIRNKGDIELLSPSGDLTNKKLILKNAYAVLAMMKNRNSE
jgi:cobalt-zinc-cadmium efflux system membrane fusion protein